VVWADQVDRSDVGMSWDLDSWWICRNIVVHVMAHHLCLLRRFVSHNSVDGADAGDIFLAADIFGEKPVANLPGEHGRVGAFILADFVDNVRSSYFWLGAANYARPDAASFVKSCENLGDAAVADSELSSDVARTDAPLCHVDDLLAHGVRKWSAVYVHSTELVNTAIS